LFSHQTSAQSLKVSDTHNQKFLYISAMALSLWMVAKTWQQCTTDGKLSCIGKESNYPYLGVNSDREKAVEYAKQHMAKDQRGDD
jgi:hypothetical protein